MKKRLYKILIVAPAWVGDMVMSQTLLKGLKRQYGEMCQIDVLVNDWARDVVKRMPEVHEVLINPFKHGEFGLLKRYRLGRELRRKHYDQCFVLPNSWKSALVPFFAKIAKRTGFVGEMRYGLLNDSYQLDKVALPLMIDRFCALTNGGKKPENIEFPQFAVDEVQRERLRDNLGLNHERPVICFCPAAEYGPAKRWPTARFAELNDSLQQQGFQLWIMGSAKDQAIGDEIATQAQIKEHLHNLCGRTSLVEVIDLLSCATIVISNDSGLMHIACAVGVPVCAIFGSSSPSFTPPLSAKAQIINLNLECAPCFARTCKFGHYDCLQKITPQMVAQQISQLSA